ncbi:transposase [candidate division TA06 bacterium]|uniref:Transposase n=1 Tax=candidate division TA06 bacterium TaxID=2250710 RepID=A0A933MI40_UNCT6|nr:transposase [candidate division TA06 bacterium]
MKTSRNNRKGIISKTKKKARYKMEPHGQSPWFLSLGYPASGGVGQKVKTSLNNQKGITHKTKKKARYKIKNWPAYNEALKQRGSMTVWISDDIVSGWYYRGPQRQGGRLVYSDVGIETGLKLKGIYHLPLRQTQGFVNSLFKALGVPITSPDYTRFSRRGATVLYLILGIKQSVFTEIS